jgi:hypothetical protein
MVEGIIPTKVFALKGQIKNMLKSNLPLQGARFYYRYVLTGALPPD